MQLGYGSHIPISFTSPKSMPAAFFLVLGSDNNSDSVGEAFCSAQLLQGKRFD